MRLSDAILKGCELYPKHSPFAHYDKFNGASALGAAYAAVSPSQNPTDFTKDLGCEKFPVLRYETRCLVGHRKVWLWDAMDNLEIALGWSRERIAHWIRDREEKWEKEGRVVDAADAEA
jgi:hypothetical protein